MILTAGMAQRSVTRDLPRLSLRASFDPTTVLVDGRDLLVLAGSLNMGQPTNVTLGSTLAAQVTGPRYSVTFPSNGYMTIDGVTGQESK